MELDIKEEIIESYEKLIRDCERAIDNNIEVESNLIILEEYYKVLNKVKNKSKYSYDGVLRAMKEFTRTSLKKGGELDVEGV